MEYFILQPRISQKAKIRENKMGIGDLRNYKWTDQPTKMQDKGRKIFHYEHIKPCAQILNEILALENFVVEKIIFILKTSDIAWILKEEKVTLDKKYKSYRPAPYECLHEVGIQLEI